MKLKRLYGKMTAESIFYIALTIYIFSNVFAATGWAYSADDTMTILLWMLKAIRYVSYLLFLCKIIIDSDRIKRTFLLVIISVSIIIFISVIQSSERAILFFWLVFLAAKDVSDERLVQYILAVQVAVLIITVLCSQIGVVKDYIVIESFRTRHYLGFRWVSFAPAFLLFIFLEYLFLRKGNISLCKYILFMVGNFYFFYMTGTRLAFLVSLIFMIFSLSFLRHFYIQRLGKRHWKPFFLFLPWLCSGFSIWCHLAYDPSNPIWVKANTLLSGRLRLGNVAIMQYGFSLFGTKIEWISQSIESVVSVIEGYNYVDCSYLQIALQYGIIPLCLVLFGYSVLMASAFQRKQYYLCWILAAILVHSIVEPRLLHFWYNPFLLLCLTHGRSNCITKISGGKTTFSRC